MRIDKNRHFCQEPWMYTLGIFKLSICNQPHAWGNIGLAKLNSHNMYLTEEIQQHQQKEKAATKVKIFCSRFSNGLA